MQFFSEFNNLDKPIFNPDSLYLECARGNLDNIKKIAEENFLKDKIKLSEEADLNLFTLLENIIKAPNICEYTKKEILKYLKEIGVPLDTNKSYALKIAVDRDLQELVGFLLAEGLDPSLNNNILIGNTALEGNNYLLRLLLENNAKCDQDYFNEIKDLALELEIEIS